jgi:hypothetical protein
MIDPKDPSFPARKARWGNPDNFTFAPYDPTKAKPEMEAEDELLQKIQEADDRTLLDSPYSATLKGKAIEQFRALLATKANESNMDTLKPLAIAALSAEFKADGEDDTAAIDLAIQSIEQIYTGA